MSTTAVESTHQDKHEKKMMIPYINICLYTRQKGVKMHPRLHSMKSTLNPRGKCYDLHTIVGKKIENNSLHYRVISSMHPVQARTSSWMKPRLELIFNFTLKTITSVPSSFNVSHISQHPSAYLELHSGAAVCFQVCAWTLRRAFRVWHRSWFQTGFFF